ncbi:MAG: RHS repeat domain-containing protein [Steroidobacteraceae bacterium]
MDPDLGSWTYSLNSLGELVSQTDAKSQVTSVIYDLLGRPTSRTEAEGTSNWIWGTSAAAKNIGKLASLSGPGGYAESYIFDAYGRPSSTTITADTSYSIDVAYDASTGQPDSLTYPISTSGYRFKTKFEYGYGILKKISNFNSPYTVFWELNAHDERGQPIDEQLGNGARIISGFDSLTGKMLYRQTGTSAPYTNRQNLSFEWDLNGNLKKRIDGNQANLTEEFFYDALNRFDYSTLNGAQNLDLALDAIGNITAKTSATDPAENIGTYTYHATKKHAVISTSNGWSFGYDANGNMNSYKGNSIAWYSYNLPATINGAGQSSQFWYGPNRNRWKQVATYPSGSETTIYVGGILEKVTVPTGTAYRHYVGAGSAKVVYTRWSTGSESTKYVTTDHLNSSTVVMDSAGASLVNLSFASFGARRGAAWSGTPSAGDWTQINNATRQGYTGHEHLDNINIVHMNGRVFDPALGRFFSADQVIRDVGTSQSWSGYAYVESRTLTWTDPSGWAPKQGFTLYLPKLAMSPGEIMNQINQTVGDNEFLAMFAHLLIGTHESQQVRSLQNRVAWPTGSGGASGAAGHGGSDNGGVFGGFGSSANCENCLSQVTVTARRIGGPATYTWTPGRLGFYGPGLAGTGFFRERANAGAAAFGNVRLAADPFGPNPGNWVKILLVGVDLMPLYGLEGDVGMYFGRDLSGNLEVGGYVESGHGPGFATSLDFLGFDFVTGLDTLNHSKTINIFETTGPVTFQMNLDRENPSVYSGAPNGFGGSFSVGPYPVEGGATFTTTRTWRWVGGN